MTMGALPFYSEMSAKVQAKARAALNRELGLTLTADCADAVIEQVWNALVGHDGIKPKDRR